MIKSALAALLLAAFIPHNQLIAQGSSAVRPRVYFSDTSRKGLPFAKDPSVVEFEGRYLLYYSIPPSEQHHGLVADNEESGWSIGIAESRDLAHWGKVGELLPSQVAESRGIAAPGARVIRGKVHLFYQTYGRGSADAICHAVSNDGVHFIHDASNPVYKPAASKWSVGRAIDAEVITVPEKNKAYLYFATRDPEMKRQMIGMAEADLDSDFGAGAWHDLTKDGPLLAPTLPWEELCIEAPSVVRHGRHYYMFYAGAYNNRPQQIGVAMSRDGRRWKRLSDSPFLPNGVPGSWNLSESGHPGILQDGKKTYLFYQGNNDQGKTYYISMIPILWHGDKPMPDLHWDSQGSR